MRQFGHFQQFLSGARTDSSCKPPYLLPFRSSTSLIVITGMSSFNFLSRYTELSFLSTLLRLYCLDSWDVISADIQY
jgi:hypothetical protein